MLTPGLGCRGDVDDRVLTEALLPVLESLNEELDVRPSLQRRFNMQRWFSAQVWPPPYSLVRSTGVKSGEACWPPFKVACHASNSCSCYKLGCSVVVSKELNVQLAAHSAQC